MKKNILIFAKTYPQPSKKYDETVCTGGVLEDGSFVRLYPISFRYLPVEKQFHRYQWIEADISKDKVDGRKESYKIDQDSIRLISKPLTTENGWALRRQFVLKKLAPSLESLKAQQILDGTSLGIIKPHHVLDLMIEPANARWKKTRLAQRAQGDLFKELKPLEKIPYKFKYKFECQDPSCTGHELMISDWEVNALYRNCRRRCSADEEALQKVRYRLLDEFCSSKHDLHFCVGTIKLYPKSWIIVGLFYPPNPVVDSTGLTLDLA